MAVSASSPWILIVPAGILGALAGGAVGSLVKKKHRGRNAAIGAGVGALVVGGFVGLGGLAMKVPSLPGKKLSKAELLDLATQRGFPDPNLAAAVALAESGGNPFAQNRNPPIEISVGLWQINTLSHPQYSVAQMEDPGANADAAFVISQKGTNWQPWGAFTNGSYKAYL